MIHEESVEQFIVDHLKSKQLPFKIIAKSGMFAVDETTISEFVKNCPACLVGIMEDDASDLDIDGTTQNIDYTLSVEIYTTGRWTKEALSDQANELARDVKNALRGLTFTHSEGNNEITAWLLYRNRSIEKFGKFNLLSLTQRYIFRSFDHLEE